MVLTEHWIHCQCNKMSEMFAFLPVLVRNLKVVLAKNLWPDKPDNIDRLTQSSDQLYFRRYKMKAITRSTGKAASLSSRRSTTPDHWFCVHSARCISRKVADYSDHFSFTWEHLFAELDLFSPRVSTKRTWNANTDSGSTNIFLWHREQTFLQKWYGYSNKNFTHPCLRKTR